MRSETNLQTPVALFTPSDLVFVQPGMPQWLTTFKLKVCAVGGDQGERDPTNFKARTTL